MCLYEQPITAGYTAVVDQKAYGLPITAFLRVRLDSHNEKTVRDFEKAISQIEEVQDCYFLTGEADYHLRVIVSGLEACETFIRRRIQRIRGVASIDTSFAYGVVKQTKVYPLGQK